jgi:glyoxylase-like metal-dependent hydrolase (beta-lactamase superfamily II)
MRLFLLNVLTFHSLLSFEYSLEPQKISGSIHCFFGAPEIMDTRNNGNMTNTCYVDLGQSYLVIDSGPSYNYARDAHKAMRNVKDQKVSHVLITHIHDDHWLGNGYYKEQGALIIGPKIFANTAKSNEIRMQKYISPEAFAGTTEVFPTQFIDGAETLELSGKKVELFAYDHPIHSQNDMTVFIPSLDVVFAGDLVFNERILSLRDGDINNWLSALEDIEAKGSKYIIGGHGSMFLRQSTQMTKEYLQEVKKFVSEAIEEGLDITDALEKSHMPRFEHLKLYDTAHRQNVESAYRTLEWAE